MLKSIIVTMIAILLVFPMTSASAEELPFEVSGVQAAILIEQTCGQTAAEFNSGEKMEVGGLSRLPILLVVCEKIDSGSLALSDIVTVSATAAAVPGPTAFLEEYEKIDVAQLLKAAAIICAGDAIQALAEVAFGSSEAAAVAANAALAELQVRDGYSKLNDSLTFSAVELALIGARLAKSDCFNLYSGIFYDSITHEDGRVTELASSNKLLKSCAGCVGVATGSSPEAGYCGVFAVNRGEMRLICVVLGAKNSSGRAEAARGMLEYGFATFDARTLAKKGEVMKEGCPVKGGRNEGTTLVAMESVTLLLPKSAELTEEWNLEETLFPPIYSDKPVGSICYYVDGRQIAEVFLAPSESIPVANLFDHVRRTLFTWLH